MKHLLSIACAAGIYCLTAVTAFCQIDTTYVFEGMRVYELLPVSVTAERSSLGTTEATMTRDFVRSALEKAGLEFIRRGVFLATDVYFDGFRRGDIEIVIDGERYPNSCPNRMDPPLSRVNPLEMESVEVSRNTSGLHSGIGGAVSFHRAAPSQAFVLRGGVTTTAGAAETVDAAYSVEAKNFRLTGRGLRGTAYSDGDGNSFTDLYGYRQDAPYAMYETSAQYEEGQMAAGASFSYTEDIPFPYLHMDERFNKLWSGYVSFRGSKLYANRTHHVMDNGLRMASNNMEAETDVTNLIVGLTNDHVEVYYRRWDGWNRRSKPDGSMRVEQHMVPETHTLSATVRRQITYGGATLAGRVGIQRQGIADESRLDFYRAIHAGVETTRWFVPYAIVAQYSSLVTDELSAGIEAEVGSRAPLAEEMFVSLQRPMNKPLWVGNPNLNAPVRLSIRSGLSGSLWSVELFGTHIYRYPALTRTDINGNRFVSYAGVRALMAGFNARFQHRVAELSGSYTHGQNLSDDHPLPEILPFTGSARLLLPESRGISGFLGVTGAFSQDRVAAVLSEEPTQAWYRFDAGLSYQTRRIALSANVDNILNRTYAQHLSYVRDPYSAGLEINEPGRLVRLSVQVEMD